MDKDSVISSNSIISEEDSMCAQSPQGNDAKLLQFPKENETGDVLQLNVTKIKGPARNAKI